MCPFCVVVWESPSCGTRDVLDNKDTSEFSEYELLDIMYDACHTSNSGIQACVIFNTQHIKINMNNFSIIYSWFFLVLSGVVLASDIMQYLQTMAAQSPEQDTLAALRRLLDPDRQDLHVSRDTFHAAMRQWISQCSQDRWDKTVHQEIKSQSIWMSCSVCSLQCPSIIFKT